MYNAMLTPYEKAPRRMAAKTVEKAGRLEEINRPMATFVPPAIKPFNSVLCTGVIPSIRAVRWLSSAQAVQAPRISRAGR